MSSYGNELRAQRTQVEYTVCNKNIMIESPGNPAKKIEMYIDRNTIINNAIPNELADGARGTSYIIAAAGICNRFEFDGDYLKVVGLQPGLTAGQVVNVTDANQQVTVIGFATVLNGATLEGKVNVNNLPKAASAPAYLSEGDLWIDTTDQTLKVIAAAGA